MADTDYEDEEHQQSIDPDLGKQCVDPNAAPSSSSTGSEPSEPTEHTAAAGQVAQDYGPPSSTPWPQPGSTPPWTQPIQLGPDPSSPGQGSWANYSPPSTQLPPGLSLPPDPSTGLPPPGPLAPLATPAPGGALSPLPPAPNYSGGLKPPSWVTPAGVGGTVGGQNVGVGPKFSTDDTHDLGKPPLGDPRNPWKPITP